MALALDGSHFNPATVGCGATAATAVGAAVDACWHRGERIVTGSMIWWREMVSEQMSMIHATVQQPRQVVLQNMLQTPTTLLLG
jgi:hypothetical protein